MNVSPDHSTPRICHLHGMSGLTRLDRRFCQGLRDAGISDVAHPQWSIWPRMMMLANLRSRSWHRIAGGRIARWIWKHQQHQPHRPIVLTGHSTGAMIIMEALECCVRMARHCEPAQREPLIDQVWLLGAAVHRDFDLTQAISQTRIMINLHSKRDVAHLKWGTTIFGSADGVYDACAGYRRFRGPGCDAPNLYQVQYQKSWRSFGYHGGHVSVLSRRFARHVIAPRIIALADGEDLPPAWIRKHERNTQHNDAAYG